MNLFDEISSWPSLHARHKTAPLLPEREQYLASMLKRGVRRKVVRSTAAYLIHIVRLLGMTSLRKVELNEIETAAREWAAYDGPLRKKLKRPGAPFMFVRIAQSWLRFHGQLPTLPPNPFQPQIGEFAEAMRIRGLSSATVEARCYRLLTFLRWFADQRQNLDSISLRQIDEYFATKRREGWSVSTIATNSQDITQFLQLCRASRVVLSGHSTGHPKSENS